MFRKIISHFKPARFWKPGRFLEIIYLKDYRIKFEPGPIEGTEHESTINLQNAMNANQPLSQKVPLALLSPYCFHKLSKRFWRTGFK